MHIRIAGALIVFGTMSACADPNATGRGMLEGRNAVLALSAIFVLSALAILVALVGLDRFLQNRRRLAELGPTPEDEPADEGSEEVVAGIRIANGSVPRWLYAAYLILPIFALGYVLNAADFAPRVAEEPTASPGAPADSANRIELVAENIQFNTERIVVAANSEITLNFENRDTVPHDWAIYTDPTTTEELYRTEIITATTREFTFTAPPPGTYYFHCTIHPAMNGELVAEEAAEAPAPTEEWTTTVVAENIEFDTDEITLPAETDVELEFVNEDSVPHNIAIYESEAMAETIFQGELITSEEVTYSFTTPPAGEYYFHCDVHPAMNGTATIV